MINEKRKLELSDKILEIGKSLIEEGVELQDFSIIQSGNIMIIISAAILIEEDMFLFSQICSMFTAKQVLDSMKGFEYDENKVIREYIKRKGLIKPKKKPRNDENIEG